VCAPIPELVLQLEKRLSWSLVFRLVPGPGSCSTQAVPDMELEAAIARLRANDPSLDTIT
jgi:hypothetical protein